MDSWIAFDYRALGRITVVPTMLAKVLSAFAYKLGVIRVCCQIWMALDAVDVMALESFDSAC